MFGHTRPLRPGDRFRVRRGLSLFPVDDTLDFLRVHYDTHSPGLARVIEVSDDGMLVELWGHRFRTPERPDSPSLRPLGRIGRALAPERLGEALLRREVRLGRVVMGGSRLDTGLLVRHWLRHTRGRPPVLEALGGRIHAPVMRRAKAFLFRRLAAWRLMPTASGFHDHGTLIDGIGITVDIGYGGQERRVWLDRILLHKNHSIHLVGIDLGKGEQRSFRLDRVRGIGLPALGAIDRHDLYWELNALWSPRASWMWCWNRRQAERGLPPAPPIGRIGRALSRAAKLPERLRAAWRRCAGLLERPRRAWVRLAGRLRCLPVPWRAPPHRDPPRAPRRPAAGMPAWRRRLLCAVATVETGGADQITALLPLNALLADPVRCRAYLHHLLALTLEEARADPWGHYMAPQLLAEALSLDPRPDRPLPRRRRKAARALYLRLAALQPGSRRVSIHASRRRGRDSRLLLCEEYLAAVFDVGAVWESTENDRQARWEGRTVTAPVAYHFYRTSAHFVARWDEGRYRVDATSAPRLRAVIDWWDAALASRVPM